MKYHWLNKQHVQLKHGEVVNEIHSTTNTQNNVQEAKATKTKAKA